MQEKMFRVVQSLFLWADVAGILGRALEQDGAGLWIKVTTSREVNLMGMRYRERGGVRHINPTAPELQMSTALGKR